MPSLAAEIWFARLWRRVQDAPRIAWAARSWQWEALRPATRTLVEEDDTRRLLRELHDALDADADIGPALAALERLAEQVGMEPPPRAPLSGHGGGR